MRIFTSLSFQRASNLVARGRGGESGEGGGGGGEGVYTLSVTRTVTALDDVQLGVYVEVEEALMYARTHDRMARELQRQVSVAAVLQRCCSGVAAVLQ